MTNKSSGNLHKVDPKIIWRLDHYKQLLSGEKKPAYKEEPDTVGNELFRVFIKHTGNIQELIGKGLKVDYTKGNFTEGHIFLKEIEGIAGLDQVEKIEAEHKQNILLNKSIPEIKADRVWTGSTPYKGAGVIVGIVDSGIDIFHHSFRKSDGRTRILFLWDMTLNGGTPPTGFSKGREFNEAAINTVLSSTGSSPSFDSTDSNGHGTHVAGIAAGDGSQSGNCRGAGTYVGVAPEADLIIVKTTFNSVDNYHGVRYIFEKAASLNPVKPAVVNMSLGGSIGTHDGQGYAEQQINGLLTGSTGKVVVAAAGNSGYDEHSYKEISSGNNETITFQVSSDNPFSEEFDVWHTGGSSINFELESPGGTKIGPFATGSNPSSPQTIDRHTVELTLSPAGSNSNGQNRINFRLTPPSGENLATGNWKIDLSHVSGPTALVNCYKQGESKVFEKRTINANSSETFSFRVRDKRNETDYCSIRYGGSASLDIVVITPGDKRTGSVSPGASSSPVELDNYKITIESNRNTGGSGNHLIRFKVAHKESGEKMKTGRWSFQLAETTGNQTEVRCMKPEERKSWIRIKKEDRSAVSTIESPASADNVIAVGSYDPDNSKLSLTSARGPRLDANPPQKPEICAPGIGITAPQTSKRSQPLCSDCCLNFYVDKQGTSMAAPHVAGVIALMLQKNSSRSFSDIRAAIQSNPSRDNIQDPPSSYPGQGWGYGKINAEAAVSPPPPGSATTSGGGDTGRTDNTITMSYLGESDDLRMSTKTTIPIAGAWQYYVPAIQRMQHLQDILMETPAGQLLVAMISKHFDEVLRLINNKRSVTVAWHRMEGPALFKAILSWNSEDERPIIPDCINDKPVAEGFKKLLNEIKPFAGHELKNDISKYGSFVLFLPGKHLSTLNPSILIPNVQSNRNNRKHSA